MLLHTLSLQAEAPAELLAPLLHHLHQFSHLLQLHLCAAMARLYLAASSAVMLAAVPALALLAGESH